MIINLSYNRIILYPKIYNTSGDKYVYPIAAKSFKHIILIEQHGI